MPLHQSTHALSHGLSAIGVGQIHQFAPIQVGILANRRLLAPLGVPGPKQFADVRQFQPRVNQNGVSMASLDQPLQILVLIRVGIIMLPCRYMQSPYACFAPSPGKVIDIGPLPVGSIEKRPQS